MRYLSKTSREIEMKSVLNILLIMSACIGPPAFAWHDDWRWIDQARNAFNPQESIDYHKSWCSSTVDYYIRFDDATKELGQYAISADRVDEYVLFAPVAQSQHAELAERCFYPVR